MSQPPDVLATIVAATRRIVSTRRADAALVAALERDATHAAPQGDRFRDALSMPGRINVIAECKRRSPSKGVLRADYDAVAIASAYERGGAAAISVLTEPTFFDGAPDHLRAVRAAVRLPLLRKDFIVDEFQVMEARALGADALLLIVAALDDLTLRTLHEKAERMGLAALVEVHDATEVDRALAAGARLIGVNNRNLRTLAVDMQASEDAAARIPGHVIAVSESGLRTAEDLARLRRRGYRAFLIGERFVTARNPEEALRDVLSLAAADAPAGANQHAGTER